MIAGLFKTRAKKEADRLGAELLVIAEDVLDCHSMSDYEMCIEEIEAFEGRVGTVLNQGRFVDLLDACLDLTIGGEEGEWGAVMAKMETEVAAHRGRPTRERWCPACEPAQAH